YDAVVIAVHRGDDYVDSDPDMVFAEGDLLWLVGDSRKIDSLK
ncbi:MAG: TrkA C-terminal domain-containing protein, partial [Muribaculaceae bacterium]|nr:TrkA C-terminal domain-containing protein [Muribaculaceae bacterium]